MAGRLGSLLLATMLIGCKPAAVAKPAKPAAPELVRVWGVSEYSDGKLVGIQLYRGIPDSDSVDMMFRCLPASGRLAMQFTITDAADEARSYDSRWKLTAKLASGALSGAYPGEGVVTELGPEGEAAIGLHDPVVTEFTRTGRLALNGQKLDAATEAERALIASFFPACGR